MCGIVGIISTQSVTKRILTSLKRLEYRGYDSAGIATLENNFINEKKCSGRVEELEKILFYPLLKIYIKIDFYFFSHQGKQYQLIYFFY